MITIEITKEDWEIVLEELQNPRPPNDALIRAAKLFEENEES